MCVCAQVMHACNQGCLKEFQEHASISVNVEKPDVQQFKEKKEVQRKKSSLLITHEKF